MPRSKKHGGARPNSGPEPKPELRRELIAVRLPRETAALLRRLAAQNNQTQAAVIVAALERLEAS